MTGPQKHLAIYRRLTGLYPASFRHEYRADLVALFGAQMQEEGPVHVWLRALRDLAVTVPTQHLVEHLQEDCQISLGREGR